MCRVAYAETSIERKSNTMNSSIEDRITAMFINLNYPLRPGQEKEYNKALVEYRYAVRNYYNLPLWKRIFTKKPKLNLDWAEV